MKGFQGYVASRPIQGNSVPQHVQNIIIRDYCQKHEMLYRLSGTEYAMPGSFLMLNQIIKDLTVLDGVVMYSMFQLPDKRRERERIYSEFLDLRKSIHFAAEGLSLSRPEEIYRIEDIWMVSLIVRELPNLNNDLVTLTEN